jgi:putative SOS response-associated peptidase YedK
MVGVEHRRVVPAANFAEPSPTKGDRDPATDKHRNSWFALDEDLPLSFFARLWTRWDGMRKSKDGPRDCEFHAFFTTASNAAVKPILKKAMPVVLTSSKEVENRLTAPWSQAGKRQRPLPENLVAMPEPLLESA